MSCDDGDWTEDSVAEASESDSMTWDDPCSSISRTSDWEFILNSTLRESCTGGDGQEKDIYQARYLMAKSHFENKPESLIDPDCHSNDCFGDDCNESAPISVEFEVRHRWDTDRNDYDLDMPSPDDDDGDDGGGIVEDALEIASAAAGGGGIYGAAGRALIAAFISSSSWGGPVDYEKENEDHQSTCYWDIDVAQDTRDWDDYPSDPCDTAGIQIRIDNHQASGEYGLVVENRWTFEYQTYDWNCNCDDYFIYNKTTYRAGHTFEYEAVSDC